MKRFTYTLMLAAMCLPAAFGATPEQMDRARAIAYKYCLRYMNNGSGYLDDKKPKSTAELKSALKEKEKENIKVLEKISIPSESEYATWDKEEFNKFWKDTFFSNKSLKFNAKGACKATAAGEISKISVTAAEPSATKPKPEEQAKAEEKTAAPAHGGAARAKGGKAWGTLLNCSGAHKVRPRWFFIWVRRCRLLASPAPWAWVWGGTPRRWGWRRRPPPYPSPPGCGWSS